jgi:hypothetical protein
VADALPGGHSLDVAGADYAPVAGVVLVRDLARQDQRDDLHLPVGVEGEALARRDHVVVENAQRAETDVVRVVVVVEGE